MKSRPQLNNAQYIVIIVYSYRVCQNLGKGNGVKRLEANKELLTRNAYTRMMNEESINIQML